MNTPKFTAKLLHPRYWLTWLGFGLLWLMVQLPRPWFMAIGRLLGRLTMKLLKSRVKITRRNLELAMPELTDEAREQLIVKNFENVGCALFELGMAWFWPDKRLEKITTIEGAEHVRAAEQMQSGMLLLSAHFLTLELNARMFGMLKPGIGVYRPNTNPAYEYLQYHGRCRSNKYLLDRLDVRGMIKALRKGEVIWYAPDHDYGIHASVFVPFFAVDKAATITGTATLARVKKTQTLPCFTYRESNGHYRLVIGAPLENFPEGDEIADASRCNQIIEGAVRKAPEQYMWMHRRFKTVPEGEPYRY
ncbi:LpxL/LpxP family Kdo(2)-lipid IV(A) lauroyl/palmitoleoyl acyltransferase [Dongshaea marina]|uniref:LpxL/LpxP family Kdo(2)-lipid IV(A) lauroyl/palmitoleoyl acyltransferase n=1 Tax=Dongshaea marina TaxID=2047966 RepID=UPI000D3E768E|nr:LpxL/LpxP family Kdo(2)-lipid IV(A) lauroyl/palmitoleoyl acyltransferase [Dongshaea marina]